MRSQFKVILIAALFLVAGTTACSRGDRIIKVADLPQTPEFEIDARPAFAAPNDKSSSKVHLDVGYIWRQNKLFFLPIFNDDGHYIGYTGSEVSYIPLSKDEVADLAAQGNVTLPSAPSIPFWDAWGGKLALIAIIPPFLFLSFWADRLWRRFTTGMWED